jgi:hypothetical protein
MKPEKVFRVGAVSASVFANETGEGESKRVIRSVRLQRSYRDDDGSYKSSNSFGLSELPQVETVVRLALAHVADEEAAVAQ